MANRMWGKLHPTPLKIDCQPSRPKPVSLRASSTNFSISSGVWRGEWWGRREWSCSPSSFSALYLLTQRRTTWRGVCQRRAVALMLPVFWYVSTNFLLGEPRLLSKSPPPPGNDLLAQKLVLHLCPRLRCLRYRDRFSLPLGCGLQQVRPLRAARDVHFLSYPARRPDLCLAEGRAGVGVA
jgi:hypothetical protein